MFAIVISEKGGEERRESFDRPEITVGRVQGNDLMLPKGNVSKRHAKLSLRDEHCVVTDLNSTNGTYVNRRRIAQPTAVRDGDRIYIGDFILRVEVPPGAPVETGAPPPRAEPVLASGAERPAPEPAERSRDDAAVLALPIVPRPPRLPSGTREPAASVPAPPPRPRPPPVPTEAVREAPPAPPRPVAPAGQDVAATSYRSALAVLVTRVRASLGVLAERDDEELRARVNGAVGAALSALRAEGRIPTGIPAQRLAADAEQELADLGPLGIVVRDQTVTSVVALSFDRVMVARGDVTSPAEPAFTSEDALHRVLKRLCARAGAPLRDAERLVERTLEGGIALSAAVRPLAMTGTHLVLRRAPRSRRMLDDLVPMKAASPAVVAFLAQCVAARLTILVVGPRDGGAAEVVGALSATSASGHPVVVQRSMSLPVTDDATLLAATGASGIEEQVVEFAARLPDARLVIELVGAGVALGFAEAVAGGLEGTIAVAYGESAERALSRLAAEIAAARGGIGLDGARDWLGATIDVVVEAGRGADGVLRVRRVAEVVPRGPRGFGLDDLFTFAVDTLDPATGQPGVFAATGVVPQLVEAMRQRGVAVDPGAFQRPAPR